MKVNQVDKTEDIVKLLMSFWNWISSTNMGGNRSYSTHMCLLVSSLTLVSTLPPSAVWHCLPTPPEGALWWWAPGRPAVPPAEAERSSWTCPLPRRASPTPGTRRRLPVSRRWTHLVGRKHWKMLINMWWTYCRFVPHPHSPVCISFFFCLL